MKQLSIIIPVYNVEKYVRPCIESILRQGLNIDSYEIIIINDGTQDKSMNVISDIIETRQNIHVINQKNQGLSMARNNGITKAIGEYILFVDSDDLLIDNSVSYLLNKAITSKADLVISDFIVKNNDEIESFSQNSFHQKDGTIQEKTGKDMILQKLQIGYSCVWRTLYRRDFLNSNNIRFIPNICFEDVPFTRICYLKAKLCLKVNWIHYLYRSRPDSISNSFSKKKGLDYCSVIAKTWEISQIEDIGSQLRQKIQDDVFSYFSTLLYSLSICATVSHSEKMEIIGCLKLLSPNLFFRNGIKQRTVSFLYKRMPSAYLNVKRFYYKTIADIYWKYRNRL